VKTDQLRKQFQSSHVLSIDYWFCHYNDIGILDKITSLFLVQDRYVHDDITILTYTTSYNNVLYVVRVDKLYVVYEPVIISSQDVTVEVHTVRC
jgi:hypothetical protein